MEFAARDGTRGGQPLAGFSLTLRLLYFTAALSWLGLWFHDGREFPGTAGITVDSVGMGLIAALLVLASWLAPRARWPVVAMLVYGALMLLGGGLSVLPLPILPLPILPFTPEQSYAQQLSHAVYAAAQLPLVVACLHRLRPNLRRSLTGNGDV